MGCLHFHTVFAFQKMLLKGKLKVGVGGGGAAHCKNVAWTCGVRIHFWSTLQVIVFSSETKSHFDSTFMSVLLNGTMYVVRVDLASNRVESVPGTQVFVYQFS